MIKGAAEYGYTEAQFLLGYLYMTGEHGVIKDLEKLDKWYKKQ